jgi:hypothetical protein
MLEAALGADVGAAAVGAVAVGAVAVGNTVGAVNFGIGFVPTRLSRFV